MHRSWWFITTTQPVKGKTGQGNQNGNAEQTVMRFRQQGMQGGPSSMSGCSARPSSGLTVRSGRSRTISPLFSVRSAEGGADPAHIPALR